MHLQQHAGVRQAVIGQRLGHGNHRPANNIGGGALYRRVNGGAFGKGASGRNFGVDFAQVNLAAKQRRNIALGPRFGFGGLHIVMNAGEFAEIGFDIIAGFTAANTQLIGQAESRDAVNNAKIDGLGAAPHFRRHIGQGNAKHFRRRHGVNIQAIGKGLPQAFDLGHMGQNTQLDLAIIGTYQNMVRGRNKSRSDAATILGTDRDILQIRVGRRKPPRGRRGQGVRGVNAPSFGMNEAGQRIGIGRFQFGEAPPVENPRR